MANSLSLSRIFTKVLNPRIEAALEQARKWYIAYLAANSESVKIN